jgi:hypothetical protein
MGIGPLAGLIRFRAAFQFKFLPRLLANASELQIGGTIYRPIVAVRAARSITLTCIVENPRQHHGSDNIFALPAETARSLSRHKHCQFRRRTARADLHSESVVCAAFSQTQQTVSTLECASESKRERVMACNKMRHETIGVDAPTYSITHNCCSDVGTSVVAQPMFASVGASKLLIVQSRALTRLSLAIKS